MENKEKSIRFPEIQAGQRPVVMLDLIKFRDKKIYFEQYIPAFEEVGQAA